MDAAIAVAVAVTEVRAKAELAAKVKSPTKRRARKFTCAPRKKARTSSLKDTTLTDEASSWFLLDHCIRSRWKHDLSPQVSPFEPKLSNYPLLNHMVLVSGPVEQ
eukprot:502515_1